MTKTETRTRICYHAYQPQAGWAPAAGFWPMSSKGKEWNMEWKWFELQKYENYMKKWLLIISFSLVCQGCTSPSSTCPLPPPLSPPSPPPLPRQRTDGVKVKGGVTVRSSPLPSSSATSCFTVSYFYSVDYSVKHCFLSPIFKKVFR